MPKRKASTSIPANNGDDSQLESQTTVIVPNGDLYIVYNNDSSESKRLLVSRYILCLSSKVFDAMIGDNSQFREATNPTLSRDGFREVAIDDDDFPAMSTIMNILHLQHDRVPPCISFAQLRETAMICDKYDLTRSVGLWPATWAQHYVDRIEQKGFHDWLLVAWVFKQKEAFTKITRHLILNSKIDKNTGELATADGWPFTEGVPSIVTEGMKIMREAVVFKLQGLIWCKFDRLQLNEKGRRHCCQYDERALERGDLEREQCDTWNLGCLVRYFPNIKDPRDENVPQDRSIMTIMNKADAMDKFRNEGGYILSESFIRSHTRVLSCGDLPLRMRCIVNGVRGLKLESF